MLPVAEIELETTTVSEVGQTDQYHMPSHVDPKNAQHE